MKERPILFNTDMVRAILDGRKTQTRRPCRDQTPSTYEYVEDQKTWPEGKKLYTGWVKDIDKVGLKIPSKCPFGVVGDRIWVRETFTEAFDNIFNESLGQITYKADLPMHWDAKDTEHGEDVDLNVEDFKWTPSIHMPREFCRTILEITDIRVERVQEISEENIFAEGIQDNPDTRKYPVTAFVELWDPVYEKRGLGWDKNPWVWVVEFKRI